VVPKSEFVSANGIRLHYLDWGGSGQPVVLIHATGLVAAVWTPLAEALRREGYRPIAYDQRGHGDSDKPEEGYGFAGAAAELAGFIAALDLAPAVGIGLSGGATAVAICCGRTWTGARGPARMARSS
jgi:pimeloyl-ACP methyl ester carboxylesterase